MGMGGPRAAPVGLLVLCCGVGWAFQGGPGPRKTRERLERRGRRGALYQTEELSARAVTLASEAKSSSASSCADVEEEEFFPSRTLRLRDCVWARQAIDDLVAAEFALGLEDAAGSFVDFDRLREQLDDRLEELAVGAGQAALAAPERLNFKDRATETAAALDAAAVNCRVLAAQRAALEESVLDGLDDDDEPAAGLGQRLARVGRKLIDDLNRRRAAIADLGSLALRGPPSSNSSAANASAVVYVRNDGSVDWEGALAGARSATAFSVDLWRRINGVGGAHSSGTASADDEEEAALALLLRQTTADRERFLARATRNALERSRDYEAAVDAVDEAKINVSAASGPADAASLRAQARKADSLVESKRGRATISALALAMERCCCFLEDEIAAPRSTRTRKAVAEFALLDAQLVALDRDSRAVSVALLRPELELLAREIRDFATRLGALANFEYLHLLEPVEGRGYVRASDEDSIAAWAAKLPSALASFSLGTEKAFAQVKRGVAFYVDGTRLLGTDVSFCARLIARAMFDGETLAPRDVRVLRRTAKDLATSVPFIIILIIPLSPIGHIFVFSAIQRFFPDFFPSCFTERRQNLVRLYSAAEINKLPLQLQNNKSPMWGQKPR